MNHISGYHFLGFFKIITHKMHCRMHEKVSGFTSLNRWAIVSKLLTSPNLSFLTYETKIKKIPILQDIFEIIQQCEFVKLKEQLTII